MNIHIKFQPKNEYFIIVISTRAMSQLSKKEQTLLSEKMQKITEHYNLQLDSRIISSDGIQTTLSFSYNFIQNCKCVFGDMCKCVPDDYCYCIGKLTFSYLNE